MTAQGSHQNNLESGTFYRKPGLGSLASQCHLNKGGKKKKEKKNIL